MTNNEMRSLHSTPTSASAKRGMPIAEIGASVMYWLAAHSYFLPGLYLQRYSTLFGLSLAAKRRSNVPKPLVQRLLRGTLESTNYFEFDFAWKALTSLKPNGKNYLDVLSPWLLPFLFVQRRRIPKATIVNANTLTMQVLQGLSDAAGLGSKWEIIDRALDDCSLPQGSFDVITSISGPAQVANDSALVATMWTLLKCGGRLIISVPCICEAMEEPVSQDGNREVGTEPLLARPRVYDPQLLQDRILSVLGEPNSIVVYGEIARHDSRQAKRVAAGPGFPPPREPLEMARDWRCYSRIQDLPGLGVSAMTFDKAFRPKATAGAEHEQ
jgi:hypothetical protein